jgi:hypothetical protein
MKTFKQFVPKARVRYTTHKEIVDAIASHKKAGEIVNPVYQDLGSQARRVFGKDTDVGRSMILKVSHAGDAAGHPRDPDLTDLYYAWPHDSFQSLGKFEKALLKFEKMNKQNMGPVIKAGKDILANWKPVAEDLKMLKGKVVKITAKREEAKQVAAKEMGVKFADSSSLIKVLESHLDEYKAMAKKQAKEFVEQRLEFLSKHDWDLNKAYPPWRGGPGAEYQTRASRVSLLSSITKSKGSSYTGRREEPDIREPDQQKIDRYIANSVADAEASYREFMHKMITKIGKPVVDAVMKGNIWDNAVLTVTTNDGEQQVWHTKMILNFSKYQRMFNQFPSRKKK